jgi:hypothetical protein
VLGGPEAEVLFDQATEFKVVDKVWNPAGYWNLGR